MAHTYLKTQNFLLTMILLQSSESTCIYMYYNHGIDIWEVSEILHQTVPTNTHRFIQMTQNEIFPIFLQVYFFQLLHRKTNLQAKFIKIFMICAPWYIFLINCI